MAERRCQCGHLETIHHESGFCMVEIVLEAGRDACPCSQFWASDNREEHTEEGT